jgi:hypothetical protein
MLRPEKNTGPSILMNIIVLTAKNSYGLKREKRGQAKSTVTLRF